MGLILRLLAWMGRRGRLASAAALAFGLIAAVWIGIAQVEAGKLEAAQPSELAQRDALKQSVRDLFETADYAALERLAAYFRSSGARTPGGVWKLTVFYGAFHDLAGSIGREDERGWRQISAKLADWHGKFAAQPTAEVVQAIVLKSYAWSLRPRSVIQEASTGAEAKFLAALNNTRDLLDSTKAIASADPHYYVLRADVGTALGEPPDAVMGLISEGRGKFPGYFALDFSGLDYFAAGDGAKAIGPVEAARIEAFAGTAAQSSGAEANERYARLYWHAYSVFFGDELFKRSQVKWPKMRAGLTEIVAHYPDAWNINSFAHLSCLAGDRETTRGLMAKLPERPLLAAVWQARPVFTACRTWANLELQARR